MPFAGAFWLGAIIVRSRTFVLSCSVSSCSSEEPGEQTKIIIRQLVRTPAVDDGLKCIAVKGNEDTWTVRPAPSPKKRAAQAQRLESNVRRGRGGMDARPQSPSLFRACHQHRS
jgi:hypothetical protein